MFDEEEYYETPSTSSMTLSSIFKKHRKIGQLRMASAEKQEALAAAAEEKKVAVAVNNDIEETAVLNTKLCWLNQSVATAVPLTEIAYDTMDFPVLSADNNKVITKMCPKVVNGFKCTDKGNCRYQHPPEEETKKIVSDMRQLKKRVVKDVLKVIEDGPVAESKPPPRSNNNNIRLCKFQEKCKFKDTTCKYIHTVDVAPCQFGVRCKLIVIDGDKVVSNNPKMKKKCGYLHPDESKDMYQTRHK
jgi:hypothetical protein